MRQARNHDHGCGILAVADANLMVWRWNRAQNAPESPGLRSKPSSRGMAHQRRPLRDTKRAEDPTPARRVNKNPIADFGRDFNESEYIYLKRFGAERAKNV